MSTRPIVTEDEEDRARLIANKAYELFEARGGEPGHDHEDWLEAERILIEEGLIDARPQHSA